MGGVFLSIIGMGGLFSSCIDGKVLKLLVSFAALVAGIAWCIAEGGFDVPIEMW